jgi:DNA-binding CsgD family transcriptional regulator
MLTLRQIEVLKLIAGGCSQKQIAARLGVNIGTVDYHTQRIGQVTGIRGFVLQTRLAILAGLAEPRPEIERAAMNYFPQAS